MGAARKKKLAAEPPKTRTVRERQGDTFVTVTIEEEDAVVAFEEILAATEVVPDEDASEPPWKDCDGWEHDAVKWSRVDDSSDWWHTVEEEETIRFERPVEPFVDGAPTPPCDTWPTVTETEVRKTYRSVPHFNKDHVSRGRYHDRHLILVTKDHVKKHYGFDQPRPGEHKQVAAERAAEQRVGVIEQLLKWYSDGWEYWGVTCDFKDESASVWRIDDYDYAEKEVVPEIAEEVAESLVRRGYTVTGPPDSKEDYRKNRLKEVARWAAYNLGFGTVEAYREWLKERHPWC